MAEDFEVAEAPDRTIEHESPIFRIKNRLRKSEGYSTHMYRDSYKGLVTVGIGFRIDPMSELRRFKSKWIDRATKRIASQERVEGEWKSVSKMPYGPAFTAASFGAKTNLDLSPGTISLEFARRVDRMLTSIRHQFRDEKNVDFDSLPILIQEAAADIAWNTGWNKFTSVGWPKLSQAISEELWDEAAFQTLRREDQVGEERRLEFRDRILEELHMTLWRVRRQRQ